MAAALERGSAHPLAEAFRPHENVILRADALSEFEAQGVEGRIDGVQLAPRPPRIRRGAGLTARGLGTGVA